VQTFYVYIHWKPETLKKNKGKVRQVETRGQTDIRFGFHIHIHACSTSTNFFFNVLLTVHLSIFMLVVNQLDAQNLFYNKFI